MSACNHWADAMMVRPETLSPRDREELREHLEQCADCREQYIASQRLMRDLQRIAQRQQPREREERLRAIKEAHARRLQGEDVLPVRSTVQPAEKRGKIVAFPFPGRLPGTVKKRPWLVAVAVLVLLLLGSIPFQSFIPIPPWMYSSSVSAATLTFSLEAPRPRGSSAWVHHVAWSPNGEDIASLWSDNMMQVWSARTGQEFFSRHVGWGEGLAFSPDGRYLASVGEDATVQILDVEACKRQPGTCTPVRIYRGHQSPIQALTWSPDGSKIASASDDKTVHVWDALNGTKLYAYTDQVKPAKFTAVAWSPNGKYIVSGDENGHVQVWHAQDGQLQLSYTGHINDPITSVNWSPDGKQVVSAGYKGVARVWDAGNGQDIVQIYSVEKPATSTNRNDPIYTAVWAPAGRSLIALASHDTIRVCDMQGNTIAVYHPSEQTSTSSSRNVLDSNGLFTVTWSPDPKSLRLVYGGQGAVLKLQLGT